MGDRTDIAWCDSTWNPVRGCSIVSTGCTNCFAMKTARRMDHAGGAYEGLTRVVNGQIVWTGVVRTVPSMLALPLQWKRPRRIFVNSMSDLFHEDVPDEFIAAVFSVMQRAEQHTFQILTKRPERALDWFGKQRHDADTACAVPGCENEVLRSRLIETGELFGLPPIDFSRWWGSAWPLPNVHLGVSVENQATADERIQHLLRTPAAVRWVSAEPLLAPVTFPGDWWCEQCASHLGWARVTYQERCDTCETPVVWDSVLGESKDGTSGVNWLVVGGESGPRARPCDVNWIRSIVEQCRAAKVSCFVKQVGSVPLIRDARGDTVYERGKDAEASDHEWPMGTRFGNPTGQRDLNGRVAVLVHTKGGDPAEWPADLRVREFPA